MVRKSTNHGWYISLAQMPCFPRTLFDLVEHWKGVMRRVIAIICHLSERNQGLRGTSRVLYDPHNENFLAQVELMVQFDLVLKIRRI